MSVEDVKHSLASTQIPLGDTLDFKASKSPSAVSSQSDSDLEEENSPGVEERVEQKPTPRGGSVVDAF